MRSTGDSCGRAIRSGFFRDLTRLVLEEWYEVRAWKRSTSRRRRCWAICSVGSKAISPRQHVVSSVRRRRR